MNTMTSELSTVAPEAGEIWVAIETNEPVTVTGCIAEEDHISVNFSNLELEAFQANLPYFLRHYSKR